MEILGTIIKRGFQLRKTINKVRRTLSASQLQRKTLLKLISKARNTRFGKAYEFEAILASSNPERLFQKVVPIYDYQKIYDQWWHLTLQGESNICWPGKIRYFALSSGTSGSASKHIPVTMSMIKSMRKTSIRQILSLVNYDLPEEYFAKGVLVVGGSSDLQKMGKYYQGDLSGINQAKMPFWTAPFYKPGKQIARYRDWNLKIDEIVKKASTWDIGMLTGVPAWNQIILERIIEFYKLNHIHEIWPNLSIFLYGGVALEPYRKRMDKLMGRPIHYIETYLASEGFIAYQSRKDVKGMELLLNNGIFMEFIPFNEKNFGPDSKPTSNPETLLIGEVEEGVDYALLLSTNAGSWRYLLGDTVRFTSLENREIIITGRTSHFLNLCGEHLSVDNMNKAIQMLADHFDAPVTEYTVSGIRVGTLFGHKWYLGVDQNVEQNGVADKLDEFLCQLNDDYAVERQHALKEIRLEIIPTQIFYDWMERKGKLGSQNKFPRVLQNERFDDWEEFVRSRMPSP
jgi:hypothetical protein